MSEGERKCLKYLKRGWNRKEGWGHKDLKKGSQAGSRDGCLKNGEGEGGQLEPLHKLCLLLNNQNESNLTAQ